MYMMRCFNQRPSFQEMFGGSFHVGRDSIVQFVGMIIAKTFRHTLNGCHLNPRKITLMVRHNPYFSYTPVNEHSRLENPPF